MLIPPHRDYLAHLANEQLFIKIRGELSNRRCCQTHVRVRDTWLWSVVKYDQVRNASIAGGYYLFGIIKNGALFCLVHSEIRKNTIA
jgi:hypothetical protein